MRFDPIFAVTRLFNSLVLGFGCLVVWGCSGTLIDHAQPLGPIDIEMASEETGESNMQRSDDQLATAVRQRSVHAIGYRVPTSQTPLGDRFSVSPVWPTSIGNRTATRTAWRTPFESFERRPIPIATLGHGPKRVLIVGGLDGRDRIAPVAIQSLIEVPDRFALLTEVTLLAIPRLNPDGFARGLPVNLQGIDLSTDFPSRSGGSAGRAVETTVLLRLLRDFHPHRVIVLRDGNTGEFPVHIDRGPFPAGSLSHYAQRLLGAETAAVILRNEPARWDDLLLGQRRANWKRDPFTPVAAFRHEENRSRDWEQLPLRRGDHSIGPHTARHPARETRAK